MLRSGAETYRVEDTINRILKTSDYNGIESFVTPTGIFATIDDDELEHLTYIRRIKERQIHLHKIELANDISRKYCEGLLSLDEAIACIKECDKKQPYKPIIMTFAIGLAAGLFAVVLGGTALDGLITSLAGLILAIISQILRKYAISKFFIDLIGSFITASICITCYQLFALGDNLDLMIIGSIMPLVPGVAITNAVRDTLHGDLVSGSARILDAFIVAASIAVGVGIAFSVLNSVIGGAI